MKTIFLPSKKVEDKPGNSRYKKHDWTIAFKHNDGRETCRQNIWKKSMDSTEQLAKKDTASGIEHAGQEANRN